MPPRLPPAGQDFGEELIVWIQQITAYFAELVNKVLLWIQGIVDKIAAFVIQIFDRFYTALFKFFQDLGAFISKVVSGIEAVFRTIMENVSKAFDAIWAKIQEVTTGILDKIRSLVEAVTSQLRILAAAVIDSVTNWIKGVTATISGLVEKAIDFLAGIVETVTGAVKGVVETVINALSELFNQTVGRIQSLYEQLFQGATAIINTVEGRLSQLKDAFADAAVETVKGLTDIAEEQIAPIRDAVKKALEPLGAALGADDLQSLFEGYNSITSPHTLALQNREEMRSLFDHLQSETPVGRKLFLFAFNLASALSIFSGVTSANAQVILQEFATVYPYQLLTPADLVRTWRLDPNRRAGVVNELKKQGYDEARANDILEASRAFPSVGDLLEMLRRDPQLEPEVDRALTAQGIDSPWQARVKALAKVLPSVQDLITMAVREVFSPEITAEFGQNQDFPEVFAEEAKKLGLEAPWPQRYWAAHWSLPSASQGFEMLQRQVISPAQLDKLLRALDVMPFWRDKLTEIAYLPFTRVDIRRMHQLGLLDEAGVLRAHRDLGYDEEKAGQLTRFVLALNRHKPAEDDEELGRLSRVQILNFYGDGIIDRARAHTLLVGLGFTADAAALLLQAQDLDDQRAHRRAETDLIIELAEAGTITFDQAQDRLGALGLVPVEKERAITQLLRSEQRKVKLPTRDDADKFIKAQIITKEEYLELLGRLGYSVRWSQAYLKLATAPKAKAT